MTYSLVMRVTYVTDARLSLVFRQRWLRDIDPRWLAAPPAALPADGGLPAAPALTVLVRDWSDLSRIRVWRAALEPRRLQWNENPPNQPSAAVGPRPSSLTPL